MIDLPIGYQGTMSSHAEKKDILGAMIPSLLPDRSLLSWKSNIMIHCIASNTIALLRSSYTQQVESDLSYATSYKKTYQRYKAYG